MTTAPDLISDMPTVTVHRVEIRAVPAQDDPLAKAAFAQARQVFGDLQRLEVARVFLIEAPLDQATLRHVADELLADPINQRSTLGAQNPAPTSAVIEVHYRPGVMDPVAQSTTEAIREMIDLREAAEVAVRTALRYDLIGTESTSDHLNDFAARFLANPVIQDIHDRPYTPSRFPRGRTYDFQFTAVEICDLDDQALLELSRRGHLFLSLEEMGAIRAHYRSIGREPSDIELETLAQTWSEHCVHKTLKSTIHYEESPIDSKSEIDFLHRPGHTVQPDGSVVIDNLLRSTIKAATHRLMSDGLDDFCISVFEDNAGIVRFDELDAVCIKVETHNHPSAIEPYGGAATGIGGCIRDVLGTGLCARPVANTNVFAVALPDTETLPKSVIHPRRVLQQVVAGVRDYGNRMGIPTVNGAVVFDSNYLGNPLVFAGCVGILPIGKCFGQPQSGDHIIALGGATGRDGIHGATFSSAELTDAHADEFSHAVQIGNAITQKKMADVILQARDQKDGPLFHAITDCGAGGFSSAIGEMGAEIGAAVRLENAPLKYEGLSYTEIWISEAQERMVLAVPPRNVAALKSLCDSEDVSFCDLGHFGCQGDAPDTSKGQGQLVLTYHGQEVGRLSMKFLHEGLPTPTRKASWSKAQSRKSKVPTRDKILDTGHRTLDKALTALLSHPNIASKHWIIRQYDHEVQGGSVIKPLMGPHQDGPSDAAVLRPKFGSQRGVAIGCGLQPNLSEAATAAGHAADGDSYWMALAAIDEAVRNCVCVGTDPARIALLDNFCWPSCDDPAVLGSLVRAAEACHDGALAYRTPFVSGKDSLHNQFTSDDGRIIAIPPTLLITALGIVNDVCGCCTMDAKCAGNLLLIVGTTTADTGGSHYRMVGGEAGDLTIPKVNLEQGPTNARTVAALIGANLVQSAHDCSDGGLLVAAAEMAFAGRIGLDLELEKLPTSGNPDPPAAAFAETPSRYLVEIRPDKLDAVKSHLEGAAAVFAAIGQFADHDRLSLNFKGDSIINTSLDELRTTWLAPLDW